MRQLDTKQFLWEKNSRKKQKEVPTLKLRRCNYNAYDITYLPPDDMMMCLGLSRKSVNFWKSFLLSNESTPRVDFSEEIFGKM